MGYLYIGIDKNNNIKIGMTEQTLEKRYSGTDYCILLSAETKQIISRDTLFKCESILRLNFATHYTQVAIDRFLITNETYLELFAETINAINEKIDLFYSPRLCLSLKTYAMLDQKYLDLQEKFQKTLDKS